MDRSRGRRAAFKYFVGISSLEEVATRKDRVCVLNILGGESSEVTPVATPIPAATWCSAPRPGRQGQVLKTPIGDVPVYNSVREGLDAGHRFNVGVVYLPPSGVRDGVAELVRVNPDLRKIVMITEKVAVHDAREIRAMGQQSGIDIFGANCLGVADSWNRVRIGGALGGDDPGRVADQRLGRDLLELRQLHHHHRTVPRGRRLGNHHAGLERQGRLHPFRRARVRVRARQRPAQQGGGDLRRAGRLLRIRPQLHQAGGGLRGRPLESAPDARRRPCRRHGRLGRRRARQGALVHAELRRRQALHAGGPGVLAARRGGHQHRAYPARADPGDEAEPHRARLRAAGSLALKPWFGASRGLGSRPSSIFRWSRRWRRTTSTSRSSTARSAARFRASR